MTSGPSAKRWTTRAVPKSVGLIRYVCVSTFFVVVQLPIVDSVAAAPGGEGSAEPKFAVAPFGPAALPGELKLRLEEAAANGLRAGGATVAPRAAITNAQRDTVSGGCSDETCLKRVSATAGVDLWLRGTCGIEGTNYRLHLDLFDPNTNRVVAARDDNCEICTEAEVAETTNIAASALRATWKGFAKLGSGSGSRTFGDRPGSGLAGTGMGTSAGTAPRRTDGAAPGARSATDDRAGTSVATTNQRASRNTDPSGPGELAWRSILTYAAVGGAALAGGIGTYLEYQNNRDTDFQGSGGASLNRYDTRRLALVSFGVAGLLLGTAVTLFFSADDETVARRNITLSRSRWSDCAPPTRKQSAIHLGFSPSGLQLSGAF